MMTYPDVRMRELLSETEHAHRLLDEKKYQEAREAFAGVRARAKRLGLESSFLAWALAVCLDNLGEVEMACTEIADAIAKDPFNPTTRHSFNIITGRIRGMLADPERDASDPSTPKLYALLLASGEADVPTHLAMARFHAATGNLGEARRVLDAVTLLAPASRDAWLAKAALERAGGDETGAAECEAQAAALASTAVPFGIPGTGAAVC